MLYTNSRDNFFEQPASVFIDELAAADTAVKMSTRRQKNQASLEGLCRSRKSLRKGQQHRET